MGGASYHEVVDTACHAGVVGDDTIAKTGDSDAGEERLTFRNGSSLVRVVDWLKKYSPNIFCHHY